MKKKIMSSVQLYQLGRFNKETTVYLARELYKDKQWNILTLLGIAFFLLLTLYPTVIALQ